MYRRCRLGRWVIVSPTGMFIRERLKINSGKADQYVLSFYINIIAGHLLICKETPE